MRETEREPSGARSPNGPCERWVQLTYTVVDSEHGDGYAGSGGGWQVKQASPSLLPDEQDVMLRATSSVFPPPVGLARFPSEQEIADLPIRLRFAAQGRRGVWCHSNPAGPDATGRPDSVFNHAVLDRELGDQAAHPNPVRPVQAWAASGWLRPFGAAASRAARFGLEVPLLGDRITREKVVGFLLAPDVYRFDAFSLLLDAVALRRPVILGTRTTDEAALWIGALSYFMSPQRCMELSFTTHERAVELFADGRSGAGEKAVTAVPRDDLETVAELVSRSGLPVLVVDPDDDAATRTIDGVEHRLTRFEQQIPVTPWSRLAADVCCEPPDAVVRALERLDEVSLNLRGDEVPAWPLAAAVAMNQSDFPLAVRAAVDLTLSAVPQSLELRPESPLGSLLTRLSNSDAGSAAAAWARVEALSSAPSPNPTMVRLAIDAYIQRSAGELDWLRQPGGAPLPSKLPGVRFGPEDIAQVRPSIESMLTQLIDDQSWIGSSLAVRGTRLLFALDFATRTQRLVGLMALSLMGGLDALVEEAAGLLTGPAGEQIAAQLTGIDNEVLERWVAEAVAALLRPERLPGTRLAPGVVALLARVCPTDQLATTQAAEDVERDLVRVEVTVARADGPAGDPRLRPLAVALRLRWVAGQGDEPTPEEVRQLLDSVGTPGSSVAREMLKILELVGTRFEHLLIPVCLGRLEQWVNDDEAQALAHRLLSIPRRDVFDRASPEEATDRQLIAVVADGGGRTMLLADQGLPMKAGVLLSRVDELWPRLTPGQRAALAPRIVVWAFQSAIAVNLSMRTDVGKALYRASARSPLTTAWQEAIRIGLMPAVPMLTTVLVEEAGDLPLWYWLAVAWVRELIGQPVETHGLRAGLRLADLPVKDLLRQILHNLPIDETEPLLRRALAVGVSDHPGDDAAKQHARMELSDTLPEIDGDPVPERRVRNFRVGLPGSRWKKGTSR